MHICNFVPREFIKSEITIALVKKRTKLLCSTIANGGAARSSVQPKNKRLLRGFFLSFKKNSRTMLSHHVVSASHNRRSAGISLAAVPTSSSLDQPRLRRRNIPFLVLNAWWEQRELAESKAVSCRKWPLDWMEAFDGMLGRERPGRGCWATTCGPAPLHTSSAAQPNHIPIPA